ncbi:PREDICTED: mannosyl-oligosaccharide 1,2-alpha-mannosidase IA-like [Rhagoletis zephyria]|uniref:mannosyl-oligosaccharide 1,2-alpha-mannosidase IA-like n=1 Tax=Rhagoletis zephyria TaxID=28612 RepID=UPI00081175E8|nr:PREDICTED: mannosyl-oligosaccharide 1,2-alpha-mannosidase IA-like [Rhagoletis zephyria]
MTKEAWNAYRKNAWGGEALDPIDNITCSDSFGDDSGRTIIASLSTLKVMGLEEEFNEAKKWVHEQMSFTNLEKDVSVKLTITDYIGGLLSAFALTADETFHQKANEIGEVVKIAFDPKSGLLHNTLNPKRKLSHYNFDFRRWYLNSISAIGHQQPELLYLAALNNDKKLQVLIEKKIHKTVKSLPKPGGLYKSAVDVRDGTWITDGVLVSFDENSKDFYYNHLRSYLLSGGKKSKVFKNFILAMKSLIDTRMIIPLTDDGRRYVTYIDSEVLLDVGKTMTTSTCYLGAMLYLAAESDKLLKKENSSILSNYQAEVFRVLAENITETCHILAENTNTKLLPSTVYLRLTENYPFGDMAFGSSEYS